MGGAQPLAATMNGAAFLGAEVDPERARRRVEHRYLDAIARDLDDADQLEAAQRVARPARWR
jgi:urocanate hydratase